MNEETVWMIAVAAVVTNWNLIGLFADFPISSTLWAGMIVTTIVVPVGAAYVLVGAP